MMTEEQQKLVAFLEEKIGSLRFAVKQNAFEKIRLELKHELDCAEIALSALTQPASPALKLPDGWVAVPRKLTREMAGIYHNEKCVYGSAQGLHDALLDAAAPVVPHTAPIEPICATGGAEWVKVSDEMPNPLSSKRVCVYTPSEHDDFRFRFVPANLFRTVCSDATHWHYMEVPND